MGERSNATVDLVANDSRFNAAMNQVRARMAAVRQSMQAVASQARRVLLVGGAALAGFLKLSADQERAETRLQAVLRATQGVAGLGLQALKDRASELQKLTGVGDEVIISTQAILATFKQIKGDEFDRAIVSILDMAEILETDLKSAAIQVGKALNDPLLGLTALTRSGITFSEEQKRVVKEMVRMGNTAKAQRLILKELESQFGGTAEAVGKTFTGEIKKAVSALGDMGEKIGSIFTPSVTEAARKITEIADSTASWVRENKNLIKAVVVTVGVVTGFVAAVATLAVAVIGAVASFVAIGGGGLVAAFVLVGIAAAALVPKILILGDELSNLSDKERETVARMKELADAYDRTGRSAENAAASGKRASSELDAVLQKQRGAFLQNIEDLRKEISEKVIFFGVDPLEQQIRKFEEEGASREQLEGLRIEQDKLKAVEAQNKERLRSIKIFEDELAFQKEGHLLRVQDAFRVKELIRTDRERVDAELRRNNALRIRGQLTQDEFDKRKQQLEESLVVQRRESLQGRIESGDALFRRITEAAGGRGANQANSPAAVTAKATTSTVTAVKDNVKATTSVKDVLQNILNFMQERVDDFGGGGAVFS